MSNDSFRLALKTSIVYVALGGLWILLSDRLLLFIVHDYEGMLQLQTYKGWFFVLVTALFLFSMLRSQFQSLTKATIEKDRAKRLIEENEQRFQRLVETSPDSISIHDINGTVLFVSQGGIEMFGYQSVREIEKKNILDFIVPEDRDRMESFIVQLLEGLSAGSNEYRAIKKDGTIFWIESNGGVFLDENKQPAQMFFITRDISERKKFQRELTLNEERYKTFVHQSVAGIWCFTHEQPIPVNLPIDEQVKLIFNGGSLLECNDTFASMHGFSSSHEMVGMKLKDLLVESDPKNSTYLRGFIENNYHLDEIESHEKDSTGNEKYFLNNLVGTVVDGMLIHSWGIQRDVTDLRNTTKALRENEEILQAVFELTPVMFWYKDTHDTILHVNSAAAALEGKPAKEIEGKTSLDLYPLHEAQAHRRDDEDVIASRTAKIGYLEPHTSPGTGKTRWLHSGKTPVFNENGNVTGLIAFAVDVTEQRNIQTALEESEERYRKIVEGLSIGIVIHANNKIIFANPAIIALMGAQNQNQFLGRNILEFVHLDDQPKVLAAIQNVFSKNNSDTAPDDIIEERLLRFDGTIVTVEASAVVINYYGTTALMVMINDISQRKRAEDDAQQKIVENKFLADASLKLSECRREDDVFDVVTRSLSELYPETIIVITRSSPDGTRITVSEIKGIESSKFFSAIKTAGFNPLGKTFDMSHEFRKKYGEPELYRHGNGVYELSAGVLSKLIASQVERFLDLDAVYTIGLSQEAVTFGYIHFLTRKSSPHINKVLIESFIRQCYLSLSKIRSLKLVAESEMKYRTLIKNIPLRIFYKDIHSTFISANEIFAREVGVSEHDIAGKTDYDFYLKHLAEKYRAEDKKVMETGESMEIEEDYIDRGVSRTVLILKSPVRNETNSIVGVLGIFSDVTERKHMETALKESETKYRELVEGFPDAIAIHVNGLLVYVNQASVNLMKAASKNQLLGKPVLEFVHPEYRDLAAARVMKALQDKEILPSREEKFIALDGSVIDVEVKAIPMMFENKPAVQIIVRDITERNTSIELIRQSESKFSELFNHSPIVHALTTLKDGIYLEVNNSFLQTLGYTREEVLGRNSRELNIWASSEERTAVINTLNTIGYVTNLEINFRRKNGEVFPALYSVSTVVVNNEPCLLSIMSDISNFKNIQAALRQSEERNRALVETMPDLIFLFDKNGVYLDYHAPSTEALYVSPEIFLGKNIRDVLPAEIVEGLLPKFKQTLETKEIQVHEYGLQSGGQFNFYEARLMSYGADKVLSIIRNTTKQKTAEEELRYRSKLLSSVNDAVVAMNERLVVTYWNKAAEELYGWKADEVKGKPFYKFIRTNFAGKSRKKAVKDFFSRGYWRGEFVQTTRRKEKINVLTSASLIQSDDGKISGFITAFKDISELRAAEEHIHKLNMELEHRVEQRTAELTAANKELEAFSYSVSHDLRAPLRAIDGFSSMLAQQYSTLFDDEGKRLLTTIRTSIEKMDMLIDGLLTLSRIGRSELKFSRIHAKSFIEAIYKEVSTPEERKRISFVIHDIPDAAVDPILFRQTWTNLISNAIKYTQYRERPEITVSGRAEGEHVVYFIRDNGAGFNQDNVNKLFGIFQRLHPAKHFHGVGIGLSIVKRIVQRHGGTIWAEGVENEGATFYISLPAKFS